MVECVRILKSWEQYTFASLLSLAGITLAVLYSLHPDAFYRISLTLLLLTIGIYAASYNLHREAAAADRWLLAASTGLALLPFYFALVHL